MRCGHCGAGEPNVYRSDLYHPDFGFVREWSCMKCGSRKIEREEKDMAKKGTCENCGRPDLALFKATGTDQMFCATCRNVLSGPPGAALWNPGNKGARNVGLDPLWVVCFLWPLFSRHKELERGVRLGVRGNVACRLEVGQAMNPFRRTWRYNLSVLSYRLFWAVVIGLIFGAVIGVGKIIGG